MGIRSDIRALVSIAESGVLQQRGDVGIRSPWAGDLTKIVLDDLIALFEGAVDSDGCLTRAGAMSLPGVYRARGIILSLLADKPLQAWRGAGFR